MSVDAISFWALDAWRCFRAYHFVVDLVNFRVYIRNGDAAVIKLLCAPTLVQVMLKPADAEHAQLLKGPRGHGFCECLVSRLDLLVRANLLNAGVEPRVLEHLCRAEDGEAGRIACLEGRDERELAASSEQVFHDFRLLARAVAVCGSRRAEDSGQQWTRAPEALSDGLGYGKEAISTKVALDARLL